MLRAAVRSRFNPKTITSSLCPHRNYYQSYKPTASIMLELSDTPGALANVLSHFTKHNVNLSYIESKPCKDVTKDRRYNFSVDFDAPPETINALLSELSTDSVSVLLMGQKAVPWFPRHITDLDLCVSNTLDAGSDLESDHPGFNDTVYRARRDELAQVALAYRQGDPIPRVNYTNDEVATWTAVYDRMTSLWESYACDEFKEILPSLKSHCNYSRDNIPQQQDISNYLREKTGFTLRPVAGLLSSRDFLNGLAFRVFFSTQYIRHHSTPLYTPEPDICHELMGHAPMFADPDFADFSHEIGLASLGASDEEILRLATCYWFSVEFGVCKGKDGDSLKAYGAGLLSSFGELEYACGETIDRPEFKAWDPSVACVQTYPITTYQPTYFVAESLLDAKERMREFCEDMKKPFHARYNHYTQTVSVDRAVKRTEKVVKI